MSLNEIKTALNSPKVFRRIVIFCAIAIPVYQLKFVVSDKASCSLRDGAVAGIWQFPDKRVYLGLCGLALDANGAEGFWTSPSITLGDGREITIEWKKSGLHDRFVAVARGATTEATNDANEKFPISKLD